MSARFIHPFVSLAGVLHEQPPAANRPIAGTSATADDDAALMLRYRNGDEAAFAALYRRHRGALYRYALRLAPDAGEAEELFQDVWIAVVRQRERYVSTARFTTYLFAIAHRRSADRWRRHFRHEPVTSIDDSMQDEEPSDASLDRPQALDDIVWDAQRADALSHAVDGLPIHQREAFLLRAEAGLDVQEIAVVTGADPEAVKSRLRYAMNKLRTALEAWR